MDQDGQKKPEEADRSAEYAADRGQRQEQRNRRPLTALLWLVLAAVIVTGSTYAWFTMTGRTSTNVTPMSGTVGSGDSVLLISLDREGPFDTTCELRPEGNPGMLSPLSTGDLTHFYRVTAQNAAGIALLYRNADQDVNQDTIHGTVYLKCENAACDVYLDREKLSLGSDSQALAAMRLGLKITTEDQEVHTYILKLDELGSTAGVSAAQTVPRADTVVSSVAGSGQADYVTDPAENIGAYMAETGENDGEYHAGEKMLCSMEADTTAAVEYWLYLEGCDENCSNPVQNRGTEIALAFAGVQQEQTQGGSVGWNTAGGNGG